MFRKILMGNIIVRRDVSLQDLEVVVENKHQESDCGESQQSKVMRVRKTMQHIEVMGLPGKFTSIAIERLDRTQEDLDIVSAERGFWNFNLKTHTWQYDIPSISLSPPNTDLSLAPFYYPPTPLRQETPPRLDPTEIVAYVENQLGDFLHVIASSGQTRHVEDLSDFTRHGLLTFGAVVDRNQPEILAHLPYTPAPQWCFGNLSTGVEATYSTSVFITDVRLSLVGTIPNNSTSSIPIYLFVPPIPIDHSDGVYSIHYPLVAPLSYWSLDPNGEHAISEEDWEMNGIPKLEVLSWIGASWRSGHYWAVEEYFQTRNYDLDGRKYASEHRYPVLIPGDPFDVRFCNWNESETGEDWSDTNLEAPLRNFSSYSHAKREGPNAEIHSEDIQGISASYAKI
ncbi:hypothetical protein PM082_022295 [Marasmius tenuissimus]|nr:hypothetical protein PM082_022295 [Marasmius tenuissimus]